MPVSTQRHGAVTYCEIKNRPMNVLNRAFVEELRQMLKKVARDEDTRALIIGDAERRVFSAGADINEFLQAREAVGPQKLQPENDLMNELEQLPIPTVAVLQGYALGGGLELALACDWIVAEATTEVGFPEITLGVFPGSGGVTRAVRRIGASRARYFMFSGRRISAEQALAWRLVDEVVPESDDVWARAEEIAAVWAGHPRAALAAAKRSINFSLEHTHDETTTLVIDLSQELFLTGDVSERVTRFVKRHSSKETRKP